MQILFSMLSGALNECKYYVYAVLAAEDIPVNAVRKSNDDMQII